MNSETQQKEQNVPKMNNKLVLPGETVIELNTNETQTYKLGSGLMQMQEKIIATKPGRIKSTTKTK